MRAEPPRAVEHAVVSTPGSPRRLPDSDPLPPEDYRRLVGVIEAVDRAPDLMAFREALLRALESWFGYSTIVVLHGSTPRTAMLGGVGIKSGYSQEFLDEYAERWVSSDPFLTPAALARLTDRGVVTLDDLYPDGDPAHERFVDGFLRPHGIGNKVAVLIPGGAAGVLYVGAVVRDAAHVPARDVAVLRLLSRHLAPLATAQLTRAEAAGGDWRLTPREREVAALVVQGLTNRQIAGRLFVGVDTVKKHLSRVLTETRCTSRTQLAVRWRQAAS